MKQKLTRVGNSAALLIPKSVLEEKGLKIGAIAEYTIEKPRKKLQPSVIDKEVYAAGNDLLKRYLPAFIKLAKPHHDQISHN